MQTKQFKNKAALVFDVGGLAVEHAVRLGQDFGKVYYYNVWQRSVPKFRYAAIGMGMENIETVKFPFNYINDVDLICFMDVGYGDIATFLRSLGKTVYAAGYGGEALEYQRYKFRKLQAKLGLPTQKTKLIRGTPDLREYLKTHKDVHVKLDIFRGDMESFGCKNYEEIEYLIDDMDVAFGPFKKDFEFCVETDVESQIEIGIDGFFSGDWVMPTLFGFEVGEPYIGKYTDKLPPQCQKTADALAPVLKKLDYRGAISTEEFIVDDKDSYLIDITSRFPYPLSYAYTESIENYSELIYSIAEGKPLPIYPKDKYVMCFPVGTQNSEKNWTRIVMDDNLRPFFKLQFCSKRDGKYYAVKGQENGIAICVTGNNIDDMIDHTKDLLGEVDAEGLKKIGLTEAMDKIKEEIDKAHDLGVDF
jgi:hypothetical protein